MSADLSRWLGKVTCGDCLEVLRGLPDGCCNLAIEDPPYGYHIEGCPWDGSKPTPDLWDELARVLQDGAALYYWGFWQDAPWVLTNAARVGFTPLSELKWWYRTGRPEARNYRQDTETCWYMAKGAPATFNAEAALEPYEDEANYARYGRAGKHPGTVWLASRIFHNHPENCGHPTQKPLEIIRRMVVVSSNPGDLVLDSHCGSGTVCVACVETGRNFIGIEIDPEYFAIAERRIAEAQRNFQPQLLTADA
jgi:site-specific DNA-methyltransferase (adenine-specific)